MRVLLCLGLLCLSAGAAAQRPPVTPPAGGRIVTALAHAYDRAAPVALALWAPRTVLGYDEVAKGYGHLHVTCGHDPAYGQCPTADSGEGATGPGRIALAFREQRSGQTITLGLRGWLERVEWERVCSSDYWDKSLYPLWTSVHRDCHVPPAGTAATLVLEAQEAAQLVAGRWRAELRLDVRAAPAGAVLGQHVFVLDIEVTDPARAAIYLPAFGASAGRVGLQLQQRPLPPPAMLSGRAVLELCLYDGYGSNSAQLVLGARDGEPPLDTRPPGYFSVWHQAGGRDAQDRIDYRLQLQHGGQQIALPNHGDATLEGVDSAPLRAVQLPGLPHPVYCVPVPLVLETPPVTAAEKRAGPFQGALVLQLRLPTRRP